VVVISICRSKSHPSSHVLTFPRIKNAKLITMLEIRCGIDVGLFLNIRKCNVLYLHNRNGSWNFAPYLDKYGEPDPGLRRGRQLYLNQKRYDGLFRTVWLQQGIPTTIARKLEAEINNGGWETL